MPDSGVASRFISGSSRQRRDCAFSLTRALLSNMIRGFETTSNHPNACIDKFVIVVMGVFAYYLATKSLLLQLGFCALSLLQAGVKQ
jgi:hypothetical protein